METFRNTITFDVLFESDSETLVEVEKFLIALFFFTFPKSYQKYDICHGNLKDYDCDELVTNLRVLKK